MIFIFKVAPSTIGANKNYVYESVAHEKATHTECMFSGVIETNFIYLDIKLKSPFDSHVSDSL